MHGYGKFSSMAVTLLKKAESATGARLSQSTEPVISDLLVIDRDVDFPSTLVSALNYEALLDEAFGIKCGP